MNNPMDTASVEPIARNTPEERNAARSFILRRAKTQLEVLGLDSPEVYPVPDRPGFDALNAVPWMTLRRGNTVLDALAEGGYTLYTLTTEPADAVTVPREALAQVIGFFAGHLDLATETFAAEVYALRKALDATPTDRTEPSR